MTVKYDNGEVEFPPHRTWTHTPPPDAKPLIFIDGKVYEWNRELKKWEPAEKQPGSLPDLPGAVP